MSKNSKIILAVLAIAIIVIGIVLVATSGDDNGTPATTTPNGDTTEQQQPANGTEIEEEAPIGAILTYTNNGFEPAQVTVPAGSVVAVVNESTTDLEFASDPHPTHTDNSELNVGMIEPGGRITFVVEQTGTWGYHNHLNPSRTGQITVE